MKFIISYLFILSFSSAVFGEDAKIPCRYKDGTLGLNSLDNFDCKLATQISSDPKIKDEYKDFIDKKLAVKLSQKTSDLIEDLSLLDSYFDQKGIDLGKNDNVKRSCKLEKIADADCKGNVNKALAKKKLGFILFSDKYLPKEKDGVNTLYGRMVSKAKQVRSGNKIKDKNNCPVKGNSGAFILSSQLNVRDADFIADALKKGEKSGAIVELYKNYPQLKIYMSGKETQKKNFESYMSLFSGNESAKEYIDNFFKKETVQEEMAENVAAKCDELETTISKFVCEDDYPHLAMKEEDRDIFFDDLEEDKIFKEVSRGLSCEMEEKSATASGKDIFLAAGSIQEKNDKIMKDVRGQKDDREVELGLKPFCDLYLCKGKDANTQMVSCKNGGPISSKDLLLTCPSGLFAKCDPDMQKYYSYMKSMEKDAINSGTVVAGLTDTKFEGSSEGESKPKGFSSFYQNFLGVEGTIASEGKKITPITIAEKKAEFAEKKLDTPSAASLTSNLTKEKDVARVDTRPEPIARDIEVGSGSDERAGPARESDQFRRNFQVQQFAKANTESKDVSGKFKKTSFTDTESSTLDEMKKLRTELADALGKVKGTEEEQLAAVADNNAVVVAPVGTPKSPIRNLSSAEKERLDAYRDSLNNWESRLRSWQGNLSDREVRINSGSGSANENRVEAPVANNDQSNSARAASAGLKLTKTAASGAPGAVKADGLNERAPGTEKGDLEEGIVNSEKLATLEKDSLKKLGIVATDSFIIKVRHKDKIYSVPVKTFTHSGKQMYVPLLNEKDRELSKIVYESPLFKDYREYQVQRQYKLDQI